MSLKYPGGFITKSPVAPTASAASGMWTLDQAMQLKKQGTWPEPVPTVIGQVYGGGFFAGQIGVSGVATHYLVIAPLSSGQTTNKWKNVTTATAGSDSVINGPQNTADMVADGSSTVYPCAHFCNNAVIGGYSDWYMPAINELQVCYFNLKPTTDANSTASGINTNSVPEKTTNYTSGTPARTSVTAFQFGVGAEAFDDYGQYWSSTENSSANAQFVYFDQGLVDVNGTKTISRQVRAIRRVAV